VSVGAHDHDDVLGNLMRGSLDHCVKCTICEQYCPVSAATPLFPGPKYAGPQSERFRTDEDSVDHSVDYCSGCGICTQVCPQGVHIAEINSRARAKLKRDDGVPVRDRIITRSEILGKLGTPVAPLANASLRSRPLRVLIERVLGIHRDAPVPAFAGRTFRAWAKRHVAPVPTAQRVVFFYGCGADYYEPRLAEMAVEVLEHNGFAVDTPKQGCCGLPLMSSGLFDDARRYVRRLAHNLAPAVSAGANIVAVSTSCSLMLKREAIEILGLEDDAELRLVSGRVRDICEFLLDLHDEGRLRTDFERVDAHFVYHAPCQQQGHGIGKPALDLFALIEGLQVVESDARCCGIAGTYGLKREKYEIAMTVGEALFAQIREVSPELVVCDSETCRWQIAKASGLPSVHPVEILHRAYGLGIGPTHPAGGSAINSHS
jgi:glycerol-3-phosphate dehydrogenase subunit C